MSPLLAALSTPIQGVCKRQSSSLTFFSCFIIQSSVLFGLYLFFDFCIHIPIALLFASHSTFFLLSELSHNRLPLLCPFAYSSSSFLCSKQIAASVFVCLPFDNAGLWLHLPFSLSLLPSFLFLCPSAILSSLYLGSVTVAFFFFALPR
ncbi:uncharacterized protein BDV17DRAFT_133258 [Aspergillus undulatus]|uniref:uncharacterized protein n=1 Tax=Aspergillus undulatus TaxID=1810928 RepID=UPI003CCD6FE5